jgi:hypothetical protein
MGATTDKASDIQYLYKCGAEASTSRLIHKLPGRAEPVGLRLITKYEAAAAYAACGLWDGQGEVKPLVADFFPENDPRLAGAVKFNHKADMGLPTLGKPDAFNLDVAMAVYRDLDQRFRLAYKAQGGDGVVRAVRALEVERPELVTFQGKTKSDYYSKKKQMSGEARFYTVAPMPLRLGIATVTQAFERYKSNIFVRGHSAQGISLQKGGADLLARKLEEQLVARGVAWTHNGDDTWFVKRDGPLITQWALDATAFDLSQRREVTHQVHLVVAERLALIDPVWAWAWFSLMRERTIIVNGSNRVRMMDGGPSGMALQSVVNDLLMEVACERLAKRLETGRSSDESWLASQVAAVGVELGFEIRLETYSNTLATTLFQALAVSPFLYIGYIFYTDTTGRVCVFCDVARTLAQLPYPGDKWEAKEDKPLATALRLMSIKIGMGEPPAPLVAAYSAFEREVLRMSEKALRRAGSKADEPLPWWAVQFSELVGGERATSVRALYKLCAMPAARLWGVQGFTDVVREATPEEEAEGARVLASTPIRSRLPTLARLSAMPVRTETSRSVAQLGRPPPVTPKRVHREVDPLSTARGRRGEHGRAGLEYLAQQFAAQQLYESDEDATPVPEGKARRARRHRK